MHFLLRGWLALLSWAVLMALVHAQEPARPETQDQKAPASRTDPTSPPAPQRGLDDLGLPPNTVILIYDDPQKALNAMPKSVLLSPERYQELRRLESENGQRQPGFVKLAVPTSCKLSGQVDGEVARIQAQFQIVTDKPRALVALGCQRAFARSATLDGQLPLLVADPKEEGLFVQVEKAGVHSLSLELATPLVSRGAKGGERGFDLGLPRCAMTSLEQLQIGGEHAEVRLNGRSVTPRVDGSLSRLENVPLGAADRLDVSWKSTRALAAQGPPLTMAEGRWLVRVEEKRIITEVELQLQVLRGEVDQWRILVPPSVAFDLREPGPLDERIDKRELPTEHSPVLTLSYKKPSAEPLRVVFQLQQVRSASVQDIGPFVVVGALRQHGVIGVTAPPEFRLQYRTQGNLTVRDPADDATRNLVAAFTYWSLETSQGPDGVPRPAPLQLVEIQPLKGAVEARVEHTLELTPAGWHAQTKMDFFPVRTGVDTIEIQIPENYPFDSARGVGPAELADPPVLDLKRRLATIKLAQKQSRPFSLTLTANYAVPAAKQQTVLELPKPLRALDKGGRTVLTLPLEWELVPRGGETENPPSVAGRTRQYTRTWERTPDRVALVWRPFRPQLRVDSLVDVTVHSTLASIRQRLDLLFPGRAPERVPLQCPPGLAERVRVLQGGTLDEHGTLKLERTEGKATVLLTYDVPLTSKPVAKSPAPVGERLLPLPFVHVPQATQAQTKVRCWSDASRQLSLAEGPWQELPMETVPERDSLPALVLRSSSADASLVLLQREQGNWTLAPLVVERGLVQVSAAPGGFHQFRVRFLVGRIGTDHVDIRFSAPLAEINLVILLDGKKLSTIRAVDANGNAVDTGTVARVGVEPDLYHKPVVLELRYQLPPQRRSSKWSFSQVFLPPQLVGAALMGPVRWQLELPNGFVYLCLGSTGESDQSWAWRGLLWTPVARNDSRELQRWLSLSASTEAANDAGTSVARWGSDLDAVHVLALPQVAWLLGWSGLVLVLGIGILAYPRRRVVFAVVGGAIVLAGAALAVVWPGVLALVLYGCEPGIMVLGLVLGWQMLGRSFERRRLQYLPTFVRLRNGSSVTKKTGSSLSKRREPTTVDAPLARGSSVVRQQQLQEP